MWLITGPAPLCSLIPVLPAKNGCQSQEDPSLNPGFPLSAVRQLLTSLNNGFLSLRSGAEGLSSRVVSVEEGTRDHAQRPDPRTHHRRFLITGKGNLEPFFVIISVSHLILELHGSRVIFSPF